MAQRENLTATFRRASCPHCGKQLPLWLHLSLDHTIGAPCPSCRYTLAREQRFSRIQVALILLLLAVILVVRNSHSHPVIELLCSATLAGLAIAITFVQLSIPLKILFRDDGRNP